MQGQGYLQKGSDGLLGLQDLLHAAGLLQQQRVTSAAAVEARHSQRQARGAGI